MFTFMENEIWKDILGYEDKYRVSNTGKIFSIKKNIVINPEPHHGYLRIHLHKFGKRKKIKVHRLVGLAFVSNPDNKPEINHKDGNKHNNNHWNLEWTTTEENNEHALELGINIHKRKLTYDDVVFIMENRNIGCKLLSKKYNVRPEKIKNIRNNKTYRPYVNRYLREKQKKLPENF
jgi:NUMOD4 motif/HNH endonuclease